MKRKTKTPVVLDVDYDFFFQEDSLSDWTHREAPFFQNLLWVARAVGSLSCGQDLRKTMIPASGLRPENFVQALKNKGWSFSEAAQVLYCDSHAEIGVELACRLVRMLPVHLVHVDAHHDLGYHSKDELERRSAKSRMDCDDWIWQLARRPQVLRYRRKALLENVRVIYPEWRHGNEESQPMNTLRVPYTLEYEDAGLAPPDGQIVLVTVCRSSAWVPPWFDAGFMPFVESFGLPVESVRSGIEPRDPVDWDQIEEASRGEQEMLRRCAQSVAAERM